MMTSNKLGRLPAVLRSLAQRYARANEDAAAIAGHEWLKVYPPLRQRLAAAFGTDLNRQRLLDFGCGYRYPLLVLLQSDVAEIVGLEVAPVYRDGCLARMRADGGLRRPAALLEAWVEFRQAGLYFQDLTRLSGKPVRHDEFEICRYEGSHIPDSLGRFDAVVSNAVLQELPGELSRYAAEIAQVLRPGGVIDLEWHNFYSWSGHYLDEAESRSHPWGHLLGGRFHPSLNRVTPDQVLEAFTPWFTDLRLLRHDAAHRQPDDPAFEPEGVGYLTPELEFRLTQYPRELLLTRGYVLQGRRR